MIREYTIQAGVPIPEQSNTSRLRKTIACLAISESIALTNENDLHHAYRCAKRFKFKIVSRKISEQGWRIWRVK